MTGRRGYRPDLGWVLAALLVAGVIAAAAPAAADEERPCREGYVDNAEAMKILEDRRRAALQRIAGALAAEESAAPGLPAGQDATPGLAGLAAPAAPPSQDLGALGALWTRRVIRAAEELPSTAPGATQLAAPSAAGGSPGVADAPASPGLLGLAFGNDVLSSSDGVLTLTLNLALLTRAFGDGTTLPELSEQAGGLDRWSLALSTGGTGLEVDRDGDGTADEALRARDADDIFGWEARWRVYGTRDRQAEENWKKVLATTDEVRQRADETYNDFLGLLTTDLSGLLASDPAALAAWMDEDGNICKERWEEWLDQEAVQPLLEAVAAADQEVRTQLAGTLEKIDGQPVFTVFVGGTEREPEFGPDELRAGLRGKWGAREGTRKDWTLNVDWSRRDGLPGAADPESWRFALGRAWLLGRGETLEDRPGFDLTLAASYEMFDNVPTATHDEVGKVNLKVEIPLSDGLKLPLSLTWANHADLLEEEDELSAHVGFTFNFQDLLKPKKAGS